MELTVHSDMKPLPSVDMVDMAQDDIEAGICGNIQIAAWNKSRHKSGESAKDQIQDLWFYHSSKHNAVEWT